MSNARFTNKTASIANGESLSAAVDIDGKPIVAIIMPGTWTSADLTFNVSYDGATYGNLYTEAGVEYTITNGAATSRFIKIDPTVFLGCTHVKVRSGTSGSATNQSAARSVILVIRQFE